jgi:AcrR family transcriptional regulator
MSTAMGPVSSRSVNLAAGGDELGATAQIGSRYEKLPGGARGANGLTRAQVAAHQRTRVYGAMMEIVASRGYDATSIKSVCALAGVSRRTFYDLFGTGRRPPKEACFLAACDFVVARAAQRIKLAYRSERDPQRRLSRAFDQFAHELANDQGTARAVLVEAPGAGPAALARLERARHLFERMISASTADPSSGATLPRTVAKGIVGGLERVARVHLLSGRIDELPAAAQELCRWASSYDLGCASLLAGIPRAQDRRRPPGMRGECKNESLRILRAAAAIASAEGYAHLSATRISRLAGVSQEIFELLYDGPGAIEDCFLAAVDLLGVEALVRAAKASRGSVGWPEGIRSGILALMDHLADDRLLARVVLVEVYAVGITAIERRYRLLGRFTDLLRSAVPGAQRPSKVVAEAIVGAIWGLVDHNVVRGQTGRLPAVADDATYLALAPMIGHDAALRVISAVDSDARAIARPDIGPRVLPTASLGKF